MNQIVFTFLILALLLSGCDGPSKALPGPNVPASQSPVDESLKRAESGDKAAMLAFAKSQASAGEQGKAFTWFLKAAEAGEPEAMAEVAVRYRDGVGVRQDWELRDKWADRAAEAGVPAAMYESAMRLRTYP